jgi:uncharacterized protein
VKGLSQSQIKEILRKYKVIAIVGLSDEVAKPSYRVAAYLKNHGYTIIPVNPFVKEVLGEKSYRSLPEIPKAIQQTIDVVDIFRRSDDVPPIIEQVLKLKQTMGRPFVVWMQLGVADLHWAAVAQKAGLVVVMDKCMMAEHIHLLH